MSKLKVSAIHDPDNDNQAISIDSSGNITAPQNATISGTATVTGTTTLSGNASIGGNATVTGTATVTGNASFNGNITASAGTITGNSFSGSGASLTGLNASNLGSGTIPDARFPSALPAIDGSAATSLNASNLSSGTIPSARFPSALPAIDGSALTGLGGGGSTTEDFTVVSGQSVSASTFPNFYNGTVGHATALNSKGTDFENTGNTNWSMTDPTGQYVIYHTGTSLYAWDLDDDFTNTLTDTSVSSYGQSNFGWTGKSRQFAFYGFNRSYYVGSNNCGSGIDSIQNVSGGGRLLQFNDTYSSLSKSTERTASMSGSSYYYNGYAYWQMYVNAYTDGTGATAQRVVKCGSSQTDNPYTFDMSSNSYSITSTSSATRTAIALGAGCHGISTDHSVVIKTINATSLVLLDNNGSSGFDNERTVTCTGLSNLGITSSIWTRPDPESDTFVVFCKDSNSVRYWCTVSWDSAADTLTLDNTFTAVAEYSFGTGTYKPTSSDFNFDYNTKLAADTDTQSGLVYVYSRNSKPCAISVELDSNLYVVGEGVELVLNSGNYTPSVRYRANGNGDLFYTYYTAGSDMIVTPFNLDSPSTPPLLLVGVAESAASGGSTVTLTTSGIANGFTGLTTGTKYYYDNTAADGTITTTATGNTFVGTALSSSKLLLANMAEAV